MIQEVNFGGKMIKCEVKPDILTIILLSICLFIIPIWMLLIKEYFIAGLIHFLTLFGIIYSRGTVLKDYIPIKENLN